MDPDQEAVVSFPWGRMSWEDADRGHYHNRALQILNFDRQQKRVAASAADAGNGAPRRSFSYGKSKLSDPHVELVMTDDDSEADETWNEIRLRGHPAQEFWPGSSSAHDSTLDDSTTSPRLSFSSWIPVPAGPAATHQRAGGGDRKGKSVLT
ncbi:hypothetical protein SeLEV6574_g08137 [Synchytrium endobioticum]|uniref:Uncharacterized protein n=1 Tax=Synchytrium endobioticum TaxID=286115 RepID=A0A507C8J6_9FUNG|nr:hypothetical protein SeLEV6574_g08137 [Synchytrium endobioticum]